MPSSVIKSFVYHPEEERLEIVFTTGRVYCYHGVSRVVADAMSAAFAKGVFFNENIRDKYRYTRALPASRKVRNVIE
ncbi:MAG: KTSC domain-containing protein [Vitreimonas sp.]